MTEENATIATPDGPMDAYVARPADGERAPAMIVLQEAFGVNAHIRDVARRLADAGYVAIAPELFHRGGKGVEIAYGDHARIMPFLGALDNDGLERDLRATLAFARQDAGIDPAKVGAIGFCMGGFAAFLAACRTDVAASVAFYGGGLVRERPNIGLAPLVGEAAKIAAPILCIFGGADQGIPPADVDAVRAALDATTARHEVIVYPGAGHGFFCDARPSFHEVAAAEAWRATLAWLDDVLRGHAL